MTTWSSQTKNTTSWNNLSRWTLSFLLKIDDTYYLKIDDNYKLIIGEGRYAWNNTSKTTSSWASPSKS